MAKPLPYQEEIEYTRALDDQDGNSFWRPSLLQFQHVTFYLQVIPEYLEYVECLEYVQYLEYLNPPSFHHLLPADGEVRQEQAVVFLRADGRQ